MHLWLNLSDERVGMGKCGEGNGDDQHKKKLEPRFADVILSKAARFSYWRNVPRGTLSPLDDTPALAIG
jgi:hypothetical protein